MYNINHHYMDMGGLWMLLYTDYITVEVVMILVIAMIMVMIAMRH